MGKRKSGAVLIIALVTMFLAVALAYSAATVTTSHRDDVLQEDRDLQARALADAGVNRAIAFVQDSMRLAPFNPFAGIDTLLFTNSDPTQPVTYALANDEALKDGNLSFGTFTVALQGVANGDVRDVTITATGYVPNEATARNKASVQAVVRFSLEPGKVFDYSYFINNWGWFYGDTINAYGNVRSNGQFDAANYSPGVMGSPRYESMSLADPAHPDLVGYMDDNKDGLQDGNDGGIFAGWDIVNVNRVRGNGGQSKNQHDYQDQVVMPNLSDLSHYEALAKSSNASLKIGATTISNAVLGDEAGEKQNVVLIGTAANPIIVNGPVVVRGDVIIKGVVTGQGTIYSGGNVYVADNLTYQNPPTTWLPPTNTEADTETWIAANSSKDFLGLFARENVVMGDFTNGTWRAYVGWWLGDPMNASKEDAGSDLIPDTRLGRDGLSHTADDDVLEGDGVWTVERYTQMQYDLGLVPPGKNVGDVIPGSGEDIDGDGVFDDTLNLNAFNFKASLTSGQWAGNLPAGTTTYSSISTLAMTDVQAALYTNHAAALTTLAWGRDFNLRGAIISRNESMIYGTNSMNITHDRRLSGGGAFGRMLPTTPAAAQILVWQRVEGDVRVELTQP